MKPDWNAIAAASLPANDQAEVRLDIATDNFLAAFRQAVEALERHDFPELAEQLCESFSRAFSPRRNDE